MKMKDIAMGRKHTIAATIAFFSEIVRFVIIPLVLLGVIMGYYPLLSHETSTWLASHLLVIGVFVALFIAMETYFPRGSFLKLTFGLFAVVTLCIWFWFLLETGSIQFPFGPISITINVFGLALLILFAVALKGLLPVTQFIIVRKEIKQKREAAERAAESFPDEKPVTAPLVLGTSPESSSSEEPPPPEDFHVKCPVCGSKLSASQDVCPNCGAWIRAKMKL